jgi:hypothetical protein
MNLFTRLTAPAAIAAAAIGVPADLYHFTIDSRVSVADTVLFKVHGWLLVLAMGLLVVVLAGIAQRLTDRDGRLNPVPLAVVAMTFTGTLLVLGNISTEAFVMPQAGEAVSDPAGYWLTVTIASYALFGFGWAVVAVLCARARLVPWNVALLLVVGGVIGFSPLPGSYILLLAGTALVGWTIARRESAGQATVRPVATAAGV